MNKSIAKIIEMSKICMLSEVKCFQVFGIKYFFKLIPAPCFFETIFCSYYFTIELLWMETDFRNLRVEGTSNPFLVATEGWQTGILRRYELVWETNA